jgi:hypothetical protein
MHITLGNSALGYSQGTSLATGTLGNSRDVRGDEYLRFVPSLVGGLTSDYSLERESPLDAISLLTQQDLPQPLQYLLNQGSASGVWFIQPVFPEWPLARLMGPETGFTFLWWLPVMATLLLVPVFLRLLRVRWSWAIVAGCLTVLTAPVVWWSFVPLWVLSSILGAAVCALALCRHATGEPLTMKRGVTLVLLGIAGAACLTRLAFIYQPWSAVALIVFGSIVIGYILAGDRRLRRFAATIGFIIVPAILLTGLLLIETWPAWEALRSSLYPGSRRSSGGIGADAGLTWVGGLTWKLQFLGTGEMLPTLSPQPGLPSNQSEMSLGFLAFIPALVVVVSTIRRGAIRVSFPAIFGLGSSVLLLIWGFARWPEGWIPNPLSIIPPSRSLQFLGVVVPILVVLVLSAVEGKASARHVRRAALAASALVAILTLASAEELNATRFAVYPWEAWVSATALGLSFGSVFLIQGRFVRFLPLLLVSLITSAYVNPIQLGLRDLVDSDFVRIINTSQVTSSGRWATDYYGTDAALIATGAPRLSGQQFFGPSKDAWRVLDPTGVDEVVWNRGASFIRMFWLPEGSPTELVSDGPDQILIRIDPCSSALKELGVTRIVAQAPLNASCLSREIKSNWQGLDIYIYERAT